MQALAEQLTRPPIAPSRAVRQFTVFGYRDKLPHKFVITISTLALHGERLPDMRRIGVHPDVRIGDVVDYQGELLRVSMYGYDYVTEPTL